MCLTNIFNTAPGLSGSGGGWVMGTGAIGGGAAPGQAVPTAPRSTVTAATLTAARSVANPNDQAGPLAQQKAVRLTKLENPQQTGDTIKPSLLGR